ncbi:unnamed protein product [Effrenium voratum]|nr:unnamed protein product [Effrenium voratum]
MDLYADECHCLWELMQNADDNKCANRYEDGVIPELTLALNVDPTHGAFVGPGLRCRALDLLGQETPEATWLLVRGQLLEVLREVECIPTEPDGQLARPGECLLPAEEPKLADAMQHLPADVLWARCGHRLVQRQWALRHRAQTQGLGLKELGVEHWLEVLQGTDEKARSLAEEAAEKQDHGFFRRVFALLESVAEAEVERLKEIPLLPDASGKALRATDGPMFASYAADVTTSWQKALEAAGAMRVLCPRVHESLDPGGQKFLRRLGVASRRMRVLASGNRPSRADIAPLCRVPMPEMALGPRTLAEAGPTGQKRDSWRKQQDLAGGGLYIHGLQCGRVSPACVTTSSRAPWEFRERRAARHPQASSNTETTEKSLVGGGPFDWTKLGFRVAVAWAELRDLAVPCAMRRAQLGPVGRLTSPTYLGEAAGSDLQPDVLVAIMGFIYGKEAEVRDIGVFADAVPLEQLEMPNTVTEKLNWEAFLAALGIRPVAPCTLHRKVAGTVLTIDLGWRLASSAWWEAVCSSEVALSYVERRLQSADRLEISWLRQLRTSERVDLSELFLRSVYVRYGGHFLPYIQLPASHSERASQCLQRLQDVSVFGDLYSALQQLPKEQQASTGSWGAQEEPGQFQVFVPPSSFHISSRCVWTDGGKSCLRWLCGFHALQPEYGRSGPHGRVARVKGKPMQLTAEYFDNATAKMQSAVDGLLRSTGKVSSAKAEIEIFTQVEVARRFMIAVLWEATDRVALQEIFGGDLARVCRVRAVLEYLETLKLTTGTQRLNQCMMACHSIEDVLADLGFSRALREMQELQTKAMASRFEAATAEARSGGALASPASAPVESVPETPTPSTDDVDALDDASDASAQVAAPASTGEDFFVGAGEILEGFSDSDGTPEEEVHSFSKRLVDFGSGLASTAGYALSEARSRASEMAQRADRQLGISETFSRRRLVGTSEGGSGSLIAAWVT